MDLIGILRTIFIIVAVYYIVTLINRYFLNRYVHRIQQARKEQAEAKHRRKEGEVTIEYPGEKKKKIKSDIGEYIPYEEIKDSTDDNKNK
jgi:type III secretory pathway component EscU